MTTPPLHPFPWRYRDTPARAWLEASDGALVIELFQPRPDERDALRRAAAAFEFAAMVADQETGYLRRRAGEVLGEVLA